MGAHLSLSLKDTSMSTACPLHLAGSGATSLITSEVRDICILSAKTSGLKERVCFSHRDLV